MAQLQYIGARYVPIWYQNSIDSTSNWEPNVEYEPLTFVTTQNNHLYISKKTVPDNIGSPAINTEYWLDMGVYTSGAYQQLQDEINEMKDGDVPGSLQDQINDLSDVVTSGRQILVIGNSYVYYGCADQLKATFTQSYQKLGDGYGFIPYTAHSLTFEDLLDQAIADVNINKSKITDILFVSAMGDTRAIEELSFTPYKTALKTKLTNIKYKINANFPNARRIGISFAESRCVAYFTGDYPNKYVNLFFAHKAFKEVAYQCGFAYYGWSGFNCLMMDTMFQTDNYHPNEDGVRNIGAWIVDSYYGRAEYMLKQSQANCIFSGQSGKTVTVVARLLPESVTLNIRTVDLTIGTISIDAGVNSIGIGSLPIPVPAPEPSIPLEIKYVNRSSGEIYTRMYNTLENDSHGVAQLKNGYAVNRSITGDTPTIFMNAEIISYNI